MSEPPFGLNQHHTEDAVAAVSDATDASKRMIKEEKEKRESQHVRGPTKSVFPLSRVQKVIKADKEIPTIAKDAAFLISLATEEFIKRLSEASLKHADRERRTTVQHKDLASVVRKVDEFLFLEELIPWTASVPAPKRKQKSGSEQGKQKELTLLDQFVLSKNQEQEENDQADIVINEDGTMATVES